MFVCFVCFVKKNACIPFLIPVYTIPDPRVYHSWSQTSTNQRPRNCLRHTHRESTYCQALLYEQRLQKCWWLLTFTATAKLTPNRKSYQLSKPEIEFDVMGETYAVPSITHAHMCRKADILRQKRLSILYELIIAHHSCILHLAPCIMPVVIFGYCSFLYDQNWLF